jgi:signal transduction histidine kinase/HAMP domain-containing protein
MIRLPRSLKVQVVVAIGVLSGLFAASALYSMHVIDQQHSDDALLQLGTRLQYHLEHLAVQAMHYRDNAPRDYPSYNRDLRLYFTDLKRTRNELAKLVRAFAERRFDHQVMGEDMAMAPQLPVACYPLADRLTQAWQKFSIGLDERLGGDMDEPRLEWGAEWIVEHRQGLEQAISELIDTMEAEVQTRAEWANQLNRLMLTFALLVAGGIAWWFYWRILKPMATTVEGFRIVANGDFAHRVPVVSDNEIGALAGAFNQLSGRLDALRRLLTGLEQDSDLGGTLLTLSHTLPDLLPLDWIGVLVVGADGRIHLQHALSDGKPDTVGQLSFTAEGTLLAECIETRQPLHIADVAATAEMSSHFVFLRELLSLGRRDALFLPIGATGGVEGVAVFASRYPNSYRSDHLELLRNIGVLVGVSLGRTIQLAENERLATIGQFASGIVHEIRNPLATINLALEHMEAQEGLSAGSSRRVSLASREVDRLERLLSEILLYARPLVLTRDRHAMSALIRDVVDAEPDAADRVTLDCAACTDIWIDRDRMRQVLINVLRNALQAAPPGEIVRVSCSTPEPNTLTILIHNGGEAIPKEMLPRLFEPFVSLKNDGTGLGLPIAERIVRAHGGEIGIRSTREDGTTVTVRLPRGEIARPVDQAADAG